MAVANRAPCLYLANPAPSRAAAAQLGDETNPATVPDDLSIRPSRYLTVARSYVSKQLDKLSHKHEIGSNPGQPGSARRITEYLAEHTGSG